MELSDNPRDYGVPHDSWRPGQTEVLPTLLELADWASRGGNKVDGVLAVEAPTGTGKSALAAAIGSQTPVTVLMGTLSLLDQYGEGYGFTVLKGKQEYACVNREYIGKWRADGFKVDPTAADCPFARMLECPHAGECPYIMARADARSAKRLAMTYSLASRARLFYERRGALVMDEAHESVEWLLGAGEDELTQKTVFGAPWPPPLDAGFDAMLDGENLTRVKKWLFDALYAAKSALEHLPDTDPSSLVARGRGLKIATRLERLAFAVSRDQYHAKWPAEDRDGRQALRLTPLSARKQAEAMMKDKSMVLMMSATIGDPKPLSSELGLKELEMAVLPHPVPAENRPIVDLGFDTRVTWQAQQRDPSVLRRQAECIADWIEQDMPSNFRGVVVAPSLSKIKVLEEVLTSRFWRSRRMIVQRRGDSISRLLNQFTENPSPGDLAVLTIQGAGTGVDLRGELARFIAIAGTDYANPTDPYVASRKTAGCGDYYWWRSYLNVIQAAGRVSRGERTSDGGWLTSWAAVADPGLLAWPARKWYSSWFKDAIVRRS